MSSVVTMSAPDRVTERWSCVHGGVSQAPVSWQTIEDSVVRRDLLAASNAHQRGERR